MIGTMQRLEDDWSKDVESGETLLTQPSYLFQ